MLQSTFILLKGIGESTERRLWNSGIVRWEHFRQASALPGVSATRKRFYDEHLRVAQDHFHRRNARYFSGCLKARDQWRLYSTFKSHAVYLDIETTGGSPEDSEVTVVGLYGGGTMTSLVRHESLTAARLEQELSRYALIVTFFGSVFDLPFLRAKFPSLRLDHPHIDLCFAARRLGLRGGLKQVEQTVGIDRPEDLVGMDGWEAVHLWQAWRRGNDAALDRLLRYNAADVRNLEPLAEHIYTGLCEHHQSPLGTRS